MVKTNRIEKSIARSIKTRSKNLKNKLDPKQLKPNKKQFK